MTRAPASLRLAGVAAAPGDATVLHAVDLEVEAGTCTAVLGPSGAGKTTLLRVVAGLEPASAGTVLVGDDDVTDLPPHKRQIGVVFQEPRLFPHRTVRDNVAFGLEVAGVDRDERTDRADELLGRVGLADLGDRTVEGLSGGEQQRINLARALAVEPQVLLLDEPLSSVDPERRDELRAVIAEVATGVTRVHVTHDRAEAAQLGDRIAVLIDGVLKQHARPREVFEQPCDATAARMLGAVVLRGTVRDGRFDLDGGSIPVDGPDGPAALALQPGSVRLGDGPLSGTVVSCAYRGADARVVVRLGDGTELPAHTAPDDCPPVGATIAVDLPVVHRLPSSTDEGPSA